MNQLAQASLILAKLGIGPREGIALGVIAQMGGTARACDIEAALGPYSKNPSAITSVLRKKGLATNAGQVRGNSPFWSLTPEARLKIALATRK
jgi:hypothetical protein